MRRREFLFVFAGVTLAASVRAGPPGQPGSAPAASGDQARFALEATAAPGGGLGALAVRVELPQARVVYQTCPSAPCAVGPTSPSVRIGLAPSSLPEPPAVSVEGVAIGEGRSVIHVRVPSQGLTESMSPAWEGLFAAKVPASASPEAALFAQVTGFTQGEPGERHGTVLRRVSRGATEVFVQGNVQENSRICGEEASLLAPQGLDAKTLEWRGATLQRLPMQRRENATSLVASLRGGAPADRPLAPLLAAEGASSAIGSPKALSDGDPETTWTEGRPGQGQGEFVVFHAPHEVPLTRFAVAVAPKAPKPEGAAPRTFYLATDGALFEITMPEDAWAHPGASYDIALPEPLTTTCVALVLGDAFTRGNSKPEVTLAELYAYSAFDAAGAKLDDVAVALAGGGTRAESAAGVLKRAGAAGLAAASAAYAKLDPPGRALAVDVAASAPSCSASARLLAEALSDSDEVVREKARAKLEQPHCGRDAVPELVVSLALPATRSRSAMLLASVDPSQALGPLAKVLGQGSARERAELRNAFAHAAEQATPKELAALLAASRDPESRIELLRASASRLGDVEDAADGALDELLDAAASSRARFLLASPLAKLAEKGDSKAETRLVSWLLHDPDVLVRVRVAELSGASPKTREALGGAEEDPEPRVREAALRTVGSSREVSGSVGAMVLLERDPWTFVRTEAAEALAALPAAPAVDEALGRAVSDRAPRVRAAAIQALAGHGATLHVDTIRGRLLDRREDSDVRIAAARALGALCDARSVDALVEEAVLGASSPEPNEVALGLAATEALGQLHPVDLAARLKKIHAQRARPDAQRAADAALSSRGTCR